MNNEIKIVNYIFLRKLKQHLLIQMNIKYSLNLLKLIFKRDEYMKTRMINLFKFII